MPKGENGVFFMASDAITTRLQKRAGRIIRNIPPEDLPAWPGYTIGSSIVFPGNKVDGKMTINGARGFSSKIADRFDLTLECIRRYYDGRQEWTPRRRPAQVRKILRPVLRLQRVRQLLPAAGPSEG